MAVKASGAPSYSSSPYPYANIHDYLHQIYDAFGPDRMFWGTDITRMPCSWRQCITLFTEELPLAVGERQGARDAAKSPNSPKTGIRQIRIVGPNRNKTGFPAGLSSHGACPL